jgi:hypothetical protein
MGEHGTFITEQSCPQCIETLREVCQKYPAITAFETASSLAGRIGGIYAGEEAHTMQWALEDADLCHPLRVVVVTEGGGVVLLYSGKRDEAVGDSLNVKVRCLK